MTLNRTKVEGKVVDANFICEFKKGETEPEKVPFLFLS